MLGPIEGWVDARQVALRDPRQLGLLALLALNANRAVRSDAIIDRGGVGKTRLATEVANNVSPGWRDGARFVALAALVDPGLVAATIVSTSR